MAFRRGFRRRKQALQWMPPIGLETTGDPPLNEYPNWAAGQYDCTLQVPGRDFVTVTQALTWDYPTEEQVVLNSGLPSLADWEASAWRLRRIVGKIFVGVNLAGDAPAVLVSVGFIVLKVNTDDGTPLKAGGVEIINYNPLTVGANRDPWIWRRTWLLGHGAGINTGQLGGAGVEGLPAHNAMCGSVADGPHIDAKTNRRIGPEERLFMCLGAGNFCNPAEQNNNQLYWMLDYRLLGSTMKASNRRNASR